MLSRKLMSKFNSKYRYHLKIFSKLYKLIQLFHYLSLYCYKYIYILIYKFFYISLDEVDSTSSKYILIDFDILKSIFHNKDICNIGNGIFE